VIVEGDCPLRHRPIEKIARIRERPLAVLQEDWFTERLFTPWKHYRALNGRALPPVTVLAHSDIGTY
jgi:hypothetical protein